MIAPLVRSTLVHRFAVERRRDPVRDAPVGGADPAGDPLWRRTASCQSRR